MKTVLIYFLLFSFWVERALGFKLTQVTGLSLLNLSIYLLLIAWAFTVVNKRKLIEANNVNKYLILMVFVVVASIPVKILIDEIPNISILGEIIALKNWANPFILFFILFNIINDKRACKRTLIGLVVLLIVTASTTPLISLGVINIGTLKVTAALKGRAAAFGDPNEYATYLVLFIPLVLTYFLFQKKAFIKTASAVLLVLTFTALLTTGSRGGFLSLLFTMAAYLLILKRHRMIRLPAILAVIVGVLIMGVVSYVVTPSQVKETSKNRFDFRESKDIDEYTAGRTLLLRNGLLLFIERPIFGHGRGTFVPLMEKRFRLASNSHNDYLLYMVNYGIIGLAIFVMVFTKVFQHVWHHFKVTTDPWSKQLYISYIAGFLGYVVSMLGLNLFNPCYVFWIYTAVIYKYSHLERNNRA